MQQFWDERFEQEVYVYGTEPHPLFVQALEKIPGGHLLMAGDGEGRHAVYASAKGHTATIWDYSEEGKKKALALAASKGVEIGYEVKDLTEVSIPVRQFDAVGMVYAHFPADQQPKTHRKLWSSIKKGGYLILIGFGKEQLGLSSGGPKNMDMLYDPEELGIHFAEAKRPPPLSKRLPHSINFEESNFSNTVKETKLFFPFS